MKRQLNEYEIIDFHTHVFPDKVAQKASANVGNYYSLPLSGDGTLCDILSSNKGVNVYRYIIFAAATNPAKVKGVNEFIKECEKKDERLVAFGSLHPYSEDLAAEMDAVDLLGLAGLKFHPEFQDIYIDDEHMFPIYEHFSGKKPIIFHIGDENSDRSSPERLSRVIELFPRLTVIAAHMGGYFKKDEAEKFLVGKNVYFETSNSTRYMSNSELTDMIRRHGVDKILFGSDYPLRYTEDAARLIYETGLCERELAMIFSENAKNLLKI